MTKFQPRNQWLSKILRWICPRQLLEEVEGDIDERFQRDCLDLGERRANRRYLWNTIAFFRPAIIFKRQFNSDFIGLQLLRNNVFMSFRLMNKDRVFTAVNLFGLTTGMAACLLIFQFVVFELNYDRGFDSRDTYRLYTSNYQRGELISQTALTSSLVAPALAAKLPEIATYARLYSTRNWFDCAFSYRDTPAPRVFNEKHFYYADPAALTMFSYRLLRGNATTALSAPYSLVLSESAAHKYFGNDEPMGKTLRLKGSYEEHDYVVTAIMTDPRADSHMDADMFASISTVESNSGFKFSDSYTYVTLNPGNDVDALKEKINSVSEALLPPVKDRSSVLGFESVQGIHLYSECSDQMRSRGSALLLYVLMLAAFIVLIMAWVNYANLTIARSFARSREVGIRKISGASRTQVALKFLTEVVVFNVLGFSAAVGTCFLIAPSFYDFVNVPVPPDYLLTITWPREVQVVLFVFLAGMFITALFPALSLSALNPIRIIKEKYATRTGGISLTRAAVVLQFSIAISFGVAVSVFNRQFSFMQQQDLGISVDRTLILRAPADIDTSYNRLLKAFKNDIVGRSIADAAATSSTTPGVAIGWTATLSRQPDQITTDEDFFVNVIDTDFIPAYDMNLLAGRNFTEADYPGKKFGDKVETIILNREGARRLGFNNPEDAIGAPVYWGFECRVVAVVEDYYQQSLKQAIQPQVFIAYNGPMLSVRLSDKLAPVDQTLKELSIIWSKYFSNNAFDYVFLDSVFEEQYEQDRQLSRVFNLFCVLALIISCLGLFALSLFAMRQRTKEVCVRKILGASSTQLAALLTREYLYVVTYSGAIAFPLSYWGVNKWLSGFALRIDLGPGYFLVPMLAVLMAALLTVAAQTLRLVFRNPADHLRHE